MLRSLGWQLPSKNGHQLLNKSSRLYWSEITRDTVFGVGANAFDTKFTGFSFCHPKLLELPPACTYGTCASIQSASCTQEATATSLLLPGWLEVKTGTYVG
jgi:hypothetical protein